MNSQVYSGVLGLWLAYPPETAASLCAATPGCSVYDTAGYYSIQTELRLTYMVGRCAYISNSVTLDHLTVAPGVTRPPGTVGTAAAGLAAIDVAASQEQLSGTGVLMDDDGPQPSNEEQLQEVQPLLSGSPPHPAPAATAAAQAGMGASSTTSSPAPAASSVSREAASSSAPSAADLATTTGATTSSNSEQQQPQQQQQQPQSPLDLPSVLPQGAAVAGAATALDTAHGATTADGSGSAQQTNDSSGGHGGSSVPVAGIVGAVVGGVCGAALLAIAVVGVVMWRRRLVHDNMRVAPL